MDYSQHVRPRARTCSFVMLTVLVTMAASLLTAVEASASRYRWINEAGGDWTVAANWLNVDGDPDGYPHAPDDVVTIGTMGTLDRLIVIPKNTTITIAHLSFNATQSYRIFGGGSGASQGQLVFDSGSTADAEIVMLSPNAELKFTVPVRLERSLSVNVVLPTGRVSFYNGISQFLFARGVTKTGAGTLDFRGFNNYSGTTSVTDGVLELNSGVGATTVQGTLEVGDGIGDAHTATVVVLDKDQISSAFVYVKADGWLEFQQSDLIGSLTVDTGNVVLKHDTQLRVGGLNMTGGTLTADVNSVYRLDGDVTATSTATRPAVVTGAATGTIYLPEPRSFHVTRNRNDDLDIRIPVIGGPSAALIKDGAGRLAFTGPFANEYQGPTRVLEGVLRLARKGAVAVPGELHIGVDARAAAVLVDQNDNIADTSTVFVSQRGSLGLSSTEDKIAGLSLQQGSLTLTGTSETRLIVTKRLDSIGGSVVLSSGRLEVGHIAASSDAMKPTLISGAGSLVARGDGITFEVADGPQSIDLDIDVSIKSEPTQGIAKTGVGVARLSGENEDHRGVTAIEDGTLVVTGDQQESFVRLTKGKLTGTGTVGSITAQAATIAPGFSHGSLATGALTFAPETTVVIELIDAEGKDDAYDQLQALGTVRLGNAVLEVSSDAAPPANTAYTIIDNDSNAPVIGTFAGLAEGATLTVQGVALTISYRGGDGNDVVLSNGNPFTYYLAEGATGDFFDNDVLIANPNAVDAPVTLTFLKEGGSTVVEHRKVPARGRLTVHVDEIPGLEDASASTQVTSDDRLPLIVERTMFWDASYYGGHTANALARPQNRWIFAEGSQGFFDTYILIANANAEPTTATLTFLRENDTPFVATVPIAAFARKTVYAGDYPELAGRSFGVVVEATQPMIAERAMYFARQAGRIWVGGHANTGIERPSNSWFHAEGATGSFFTTFILLSNPQNEEAKVGLRFLLDNGTVVTKEKTIPALQRLTINPAVEDARLANAALSTIVESNVPIVSERSMYWQEDVTAFGEGHNSTGVTQTSTRWGLAEGRVGGPRGFVTYVLLANPSDTAAEVSVTYLRPAGAPIVKTYTVPPTSRFNIDVKSSVPELEGESFGAVIDVTNDVQIAVERSLYWNANGVLWAGGTNALATPITVP